MNVLDSPHRHPDDENGRAPSAAQAKADQLFELHATVLEHDERIDDLERTRPYRGVERTLLVVLVALAVATLAGVVSLASDAHRLVEALPALKRLAHEAE